MFFKFLINLCHNMSSICLIGSCCCLNCFVSVFCVCQHYGTVENYSILEFHLNTHHMNARVVVTEYHTSMSECGFVNGWNHWVTFCWELFWCSIKNKLLKNGKCVKYKRARWHFTFNDLIYYERKTFSEKFNIL